MDILGKNNDILSTINISWIENSKIGYSVEFRNYTQIYTSFQKILFCSKRWHKKPQAAFNVYKITLNMQN